MKITMSETSTRATTLTSNLREKRAWKAKKIEWGRGDKVSIVTSDGVELLGLGLFHQLVFVQARYWTLYSMITCGKAVP
jgi:hypothetical protein